MTPAPTWFRMIQAAYLVAAGGAMVLFVLWTISPGFRYWLWQESRELQYRWARWEYDMRHQAVPDWVESLKKSDLPHEE